MSRTTTTRKVPQHPVMQRESELATAQTLLALVGDPTLVSRVRGVSDAFRGFTGPTGTDRLEDAYVELLGTVENFEDLNNIAYATAIQLGVCGLFANYEQLEPEIGEAGEELWAVSDSSFIVATWAEWFCAWWAISGDEARSVREFLEVAVKLSDPEVDVAAVLSDLRTDRAVSTPRGAPRTPADPTNALGPLMMIVLTERYAFEDQFTELKASEFMALFDDGCDPFLAAVHANVIFGPFQDE